VRREWQPEELIASWTLIDRDWELLSNKSGATRLGFALLLRFFDLEARFPAHPGELPPAAVDYVAGQAKVPADALAEYDWLLADIQDGDGVVAEDGDGIGDRGPQIGPKTAKPRTRATPR
jgi:Domain of unknown function (DUF4158)